MDKEEINLDEQGVILWIPEDAFKVKLVCSVIQEDKVIEVEKTLNNRDIVEAHQEWEEYCERWVITEEGRKYLEGLKKKSTLDKTDYR